MICTYFSLLIANTKKGITIIVTGSILFSRLQTPRGAERNLFVFSYTHFSYHSWVRVFMHSVFGLNPLFRIM